MLCAPRGLPLQKLQSRRAEVRNCTTIKRRGYPGDQGNNGVVRRAGARSAFIIKMPKAGGASFVQEMAVLNCDEYGNSARLAWAERGGGLLKETDGGADLFFMLREPLQHIHSMYYFCQDTSLFPTRTGNFTVVGMHDWFRGWVEQPEEQGIWPHRGAACPFYPRNFQTATLWQASRGGYAYHKATWKALAADPAGSLDHALCTVRRARFVGVTHHMRESVCAAAYLLHGRLPHRCSCAGGARTVRKITHRRGKAVVRRAPLVSPLRIVLLHCDQRRVPRFVPNPTPSTARLPPRLHCQVGPRVLPYA